MQHTFRVKCGGKIAAEVGIDNTLPDYESTTGRFCHWVRAVPYRPADLTPAARRLLSLDSTSRDVYFRDNTAPTHPQFDVPCRHVSTSIPHADCAADMVDCTDWLNRIAGASSAYSA